MFDDDDQWCDDDGYRDPDPWEYDDYHADHVNSDGTTMNAEDYEDREDERALYTLLAQQQRRVKLLDFVKPVVPKKNRPLRRQQYLGPADLRHVRDALALQLEQLYDTSKQPTPGGYAWDVADRLRGIVFLQLTRDEAFEWLAELLGWDGTEKR